MVALFENTVLSPPAEGTYNQLKNTAVWIQKRNHVTVPAAWHIIKGIINSCFAEWQEPLLGQLSSVHSYSFLPSRCF